MNDNCKGKPKPDKLCAYINFSNGNYCDKVELNLIDYEVIVEDNKTYVVRKKPQYPKTYKENCNVLGLDTMDNDAKGYKHELIIRFQELLIARDAYWKIAGGWEPDWKNREEFKYCIDKYDGVIRKCVLLCANAVLAFPTEEMRDAFFENFKQEIELSKELL